MAIHNRRLRRPFSASNQDILRIVNTPLIQYRVKEAQDAGLNHIAIVTGRGKRALADDLCLNIRGAGVLAYKLQVQYFDCGSVEGYAEASNFCFQELYLNGH